MTFANCAHCGKPRLVVQAGTKHARLRSHVALDSTGKNRTCPGSGHPIRQEASHP